MEDAAQAAAAPGVPGAPAPGHRVWPPRRQVLPNRSNIPAQQRLLPMPTFGRQPVAVVAGQAEWGLGFGGLGPGFTLRFFRLQWNAPCMTFGLVLEVP